MNLENFEDQLLLNLLEFVLSPSLGNLSELQNQKLMELMQTLTLDPDIIGYVFWPTQYGLGEIPTPEEVFQKTKNYNPIQL